MGQVTIAKDTFSRVPVCVDLEGLQISIENEPKDNMSILYFWEVVSL